VPVPAATPVAKLPRVRRDMAIVVDDALPAQELLDALRDARTPTMEEISIFDVYRGAAIGPGKKSVAILVVMQDTERTLTDPEIDAAMARLLRVAVDRFNGALRQ
jgi:phenylalanyl-tRNA synthetase beta chain